MISLIPLLLLAQASSPPTTPPPVNTGSRTRTLFSYEDYPKKALKHRWEGTVVAEVVISKEGVVRACRIIQSSGYDVLDSKTCEIMMTRARFVPAKDKDGKPVEDVLRTPPIMWRIAP